MNFLAHVYLSGSNMQLAIGNLIADRIKGKKINLLTPEIRAGVILHRDIDHFTDHHHIFRECVTKLFPKYRHYSRVIVDMYFDHFLALNWTYFHTIPLNDYSNNFYKELERKSPEFTDDIQNFIKAGSDIISFHPEADENSDEIISLIKRANCKVGIAIHPNVEVETIKKYLNANRQFSL